MPSVSDIQVVVRNTDWDYDALEWVEARAFSANPAGGNVTVLNWPASQAVTGTFWQATQPVSAASLPLPAGAALEATLALIKAKTDNLDAALTTLATQATLALLLTELQAKADLAETQPVSLATAPSTPVTGTFWQATQPVSGTFWQGTQPVSGTFWQTTQPVSLATAPTTPVTGTFWQATQPVSGTFWQATQPVSGTFWQTTQPVSGTVTANPATAAGKTITYVSVNQSGAGTTALAGASVGNKHKVIGALLVLSVAGTLKFTDGVGDLSGPMDLAANAGFVLGTSAFPWLETAATNRALNLVTTLGAARGVVAILTEP